MPLRFDVAHLYHTCAHEPDRRERPASETLRVDRLEACGREVACHGTRSRGRRIRDGDPFDEEWARIAPSTAFVGTRLPADHGPAGNFQCRMETTTCRPRNPPDRFSRLPPCRHARARRRTPRTHRAYSAAVCSDFRDIERRQMRESPTADASRPRRETRCHDAGKKLDGHKRNPIVDADGLPPGSVNPRCSRFWIRLRIIGQAPEASRSVIPIPPTSHRIGHDFDDPRFPGQG